MANQLETITGVSSFDRIGLTASGAAASMGASYAGAGGTLMKGADSLLRSGADADITGKRGEIIAQQYNTRQNTKRSGAESSNDRSARESIRKLQQELQEITAAKEAEAMEKQLGLMKAASALEAEYERLSRKSVSDIGRAKLGTSGVGEFLVDTGVAGAQIAADAVANTLIPGSSIALKGVRSFGDASQEARKAGASVGQQVTYGGLTAGKDMFLEKRFDRLGGIYGKGALDEIAYAPQLKESVEEFASTLAQPLLRGVYNEDALGEYDMSMFKDTLRNAAIAGVASGAISAWDDAQNWALDKAYDMATSPQIQARIRKSYASTPVQSSEESYFLF